MSPPLEFLRIPLAVLLPPSGVFHRVGLARQFRVDSVSTLPGHILGIVYAVGIIARR